MEIIKAPYLTLEDICGITTNFLVKYSKLDQIPVDIESLVEIDLEIEIIPCLGMEDQLNTVGFFIS